MAFQSLEFALFFLSVWAVYWLLPTKKQNVLLLIASYFFYGWADYRFVALLLLTTTVTYFCALRMEAATEQTSRRRYLQLSLLWSLGTLGFFKYFQFFQQGFADLLKLFGIPFQPQLLAIALPIGISFYSFQAISYAMDVYRRKFPAEKSWSDFALYIAFFPQLLAGPIHRARRLLPQIKASRRLRQQGAASGTLLVFWGFFEKYFVADNLSAIVGAFYRTPPPYEGLAVLLSNLAFAVLLFADFDGYSNIARGLGKFLGFELSINFRYPYMSTNPQEFWGRWHISLSSWLHDYLFVPLGGHKGGRLLAARNVLLTFALAGLWHGANWTFICFGLFHGILLCLYYVMLPMFVRIGAALRLPQQVSFPLRVAAFFVLISLSSVFLRAASIAQAFELLSGLFSNFHWQTDFSIFLSAWQYDATTMRELAQMIALLAFIPFVIHVLQFRSRAQDITFVLKWPLLCRGVFYFVCFYLLLLFSGNEQHAHIYFQF